MLSLLTFGVYVRVLSLHAADVPLIDDVDTAYVLLRADLGQVFVVRIVDWVLFERRVHLVLASHGRESVIVSLKGLSCRLRDDVARR